MFEHPHLVVLYNVFTVNRALLVILSESLKFVQVVKGIKG